MIDVYLSTIGAQAATLAREYGLGIEVAEFSYAVNMDTDFSHWEELTRANLSGIEKRIFHAPYNELCPSAVDPLIAQVTRQRLDQAYELTRLFEIDRMVVHSGYVTRMYFKDWFAEQSAAFWCDFLSDKPSDFQLLLENVMEEGPELLRDIVERVDDERFRLCLDVGHAGGAFSEVSIASWVEECAPYLGHVHIHNNYYEKDDHNPPGDGLIDMNDVINRIVALQPRATFTAETSDLHSALSWFQDQGFLPGKPSRI